MLFRSRWVGCDAAHGNDHAFPDGLELPEGVWYFAAVNAKEQAFRDKTEGNQQILVGNGFPTVYYNQKDPRWADLPYGTDDIGGYGCGPTAMAMVISSMTNTTIDPPAMAQWAYENGYWASESGTYHAFIPECAEAFGLKAKSFSSRDAESLQDALLSGNLLVALMGQIGRAHV